MFEPVGTGGWDSVAWSVIGQIEVTFLVVFRRHGLMIYSGRVERISGVCGNLCAAQAAKEGETRSVK